MKKNIWTSLAFVFFIIGTLLFSVYIINILNSDGFSWTGKFDFETSGQSGDFIGGVVSTFWAASGIVLIYENYRLQKKEFKKTQEAIQIQMLQQGVFTLIDDLKSFINSIDIFGKLPGGTEKYEKSNFFVFCDHKLKSDPKILNYMMASRVHSNVSSMPIEWITDAIENELLSGDENYKVIFRTFLVKLRTILFSLNEIRKIDKINTIAFDFFVSQLTPKMLEVVFYSSLVKRNEKIYLLLKELDFFSLVEVNLEFSSHKTEYESPRL